VNRLRCMQVGKLDHVVDGTIHANSVTNKVESIPIPHNRMSHMLQFFIKVLFSPLLSLGINDPSDHLPTLCIIKLCDDMYGVHN
jgi:hypothetical protein